MWRTPPTPSRTAEAARLPRLPRFAAEERRGVDALFISQAGRYAHSSTRRRGRSAQRTACPSQRTSCRVTLAATSPMMLYWPNMKRADACLGAVIDALKYRAQHARQRHRWTRRRSTGSGAPLPARPALALRHGRPRHRCPTAADIEAAAKRLDGVAVRTPLINAPVLDERLGARVFLKAETLQRTGSFKFRGAYNKISSIPPERRARRRGGLFVRQPRARRGGGGAAARHAARPS